MSVDPFDPFVLRMMADSYKAQAQDVLTRYEQVRSDLPREGNDVFRLCLAAFLNLHRDTVDAVVWRWYYYNEYDDNNYSSGVRAEGPYIVLKEKVWQDCYANFAPKHWHTNVPLTFDELIDETAEYGGIRYSLNADQDANSCDDRFSDADYKKLIKPILDDSESLLNPLIYTFVNDWTERLAIFPLNKEITVTSDGKWTSEDYYHEQ